MTFGRGSRREDGRGEADRKRGVLFAESVGPKRVESNFNPKTQALGSEPWGTLRVFCELSRRVLVALRV